MTNTSMAVSMAQVRWRSLLILAKSCACSSQTLRRVPTRDASC